MFNFIEFLFSLLKGIYNTCAKYTQIKKRQAEHAYFLQDFLGIFCTSKNIILLDAQIKEYNTKLSTTPKKSDNSQNNTKTTPTAPLLQNLNHNHPVFLVPRSFRNIALTGFITSRSNYPRNPIQYIITQQPNIEDTYEQIKEQPHTTTFRSQNNHLFSPR